MNLDIRHILLLSVVPLATACPNNPEPEPFIIDEEVYAERMGDPALNATADQLRDFADGREIALKRFDTSNGLGPNFNVSFCGSCHEQPDFGGASPRYRDFYLVGSKLSDGSVVTLGVNGVQTRFNAETQFNTTEEDANLFARRSSIPFFGVGALAAVPEESILRNADPDDADGDGISGRANYDRGFVGRFGRKAQTVSLEGFIRGPLFNHVGITSNPLSDELKARLPVPSANFDDPPLLRNCVGCQAAAPEEPTTDNDGVPDPELSEEDLFDLVSFAMLMGAPKPDDPTEQTLRGERIFAQINCTGCHVPGLQGNNGFVMAYSDLLLHDMGEDLADGFTQGLASGSEFRTQPLWGVTAVGPYLHDGRADTLDEAIRWHGGEAESSREAYEALDQSDRDDILAFLHSLGGADQKSPGLVPPKTPVAASGYGSPLDDADRDQFLAGRDAFDRDIALEEGLGDGFNGDSCRACHLEPTIGGAGPAGLNVIRQGSYMESQWTEPEGGTLLHRFSSVDLSARPRASAGTNVFEMRQTPPLYGLGLIDRIPEMAIAMQEDPEDLDADGISGRAHRMSDDSIGRFGWKAQLPSLEDFARDALSAENGLTLAEGPFLAGSTTDTDDLPDPEFDGPHYTDLVYYLENLAPPSPGGTNATFEAIGCADCHTPKMETADGTEVWLYSNLLLHEVAPADYLGIVDGQANGREFRTPPLWGVGDTGPYMHDGLSPTLDHAIRRHAGEAQASVDAYEMLDDTERDALLDFLESL